MCQILELSGKCHQKGYSSTKNRSQSFIVDSEWISRRSSSHYMDQKSSAWTPRVRKVCKLACLKYRREVQEFDGNPWRDPSSVKLDSLLNNMKSLTWVKWDTGPESFEHLSVYNLHKVAIRRFSCGPNGMKMTHCCWKHACLSSCSNSFRITASFWGGWASSVGTSCITTGSIVVKLRYLWEAAQIRGLAPSHHR